MDLFFSSLNFRHSLLITHHSKYPTRLAPSLICHHTIFFILFVGPIPVTQCSFFFFFFFGSITEPNEKKKEKKKKPRSKGRRSHLVWKEKEKKKEDEETHTPNPVKKERKKKKGWLKVAAKVWQWVPPCVLFTEMPLSYELWKLKTTKMCY